MKKRVPVIFRFDSSVRWITTSDGLLLLPRALTSDCIKFIFGRRMLSFRDRHFVYFFSKLPLLNPRAQMFRISLTRFLYWAQPLGMRMILLRGTSKCLGDPRIEDQGLENAQIFLVKSFLSFNCRENTTKQTQQYLNMSDFCIFNLRRAPQFVCHRRLFLHVSFRTIFEAFLCTVL